MTGRSGILRDFSQNASASSTAQLKPYPDEQDRFIVPVGAKAAIPMSRGLRLLAEGSGDVLMDEEPVLATFFPYAGVADL